MMLNLTQFRSKTVGLPDLLPWAMSVDDGIVLTKAGGYLAAWEYAGPDLDSATHAELGAMAARINSALALGDGWVLHCDAVRSPVQDYAPPGAFPDRTTRLIDDLRREHHLRAGTGYVNRNILALTWFPPTDREAKAGGLFVEGGEEGGAARALVSFKQSLREIEGRLKSFLRIRRLRDSVDERGMVDSPLLAHLERCVSFEDRGLRTPAMPLYLDALLGAHDLATGFQPRIGRRHVAALSIEGFPSHSFPGILDVLARLPVPYRWSNRFIFLDPRQAEKIINKYRGQWSQKRKSLLNTAREEAGGQATHIDLHADSQTNDAVAALAEATSGAVRYGYYSPVVLLAHEDAGLLDDVAREVQTVVQNHGFGCRIEEVNALEAWLGSLPGNTAANVRRPLIHTLNLAHLLPFTGIWAGPEKHPCPFYPPESPPLLYAHTDGSTPFRLSLHAGDVGHTLIAGPTGMGKSTLLATLIAQHFRYPRAQVFAFDKKYSLMPLVLAAGGQHYDIAGEGPELAFCPLGRIDRTPEQAWASEWIESLAELQGLAMTPALRAEIHRAVVQLAGSTTQASERTLTDLATTLQSHELREAIGYYTVKGPAGHMLDAQSDGLADDIFQVFEMGHLMDRGEKILLPVLSYLFHRIEQRFRDEPTLLVLDEAWVMLDHPAFRAKIREWLKVLRDANVAVVFATQNLTDLIGSGIADVIFESCPTKILLANVEAETDNSRPFYERMGLNARQVGIVAHMTPKRDYYMLHPEGRRLFELGLSPGELAFVGASGKENVARIRELRGELGDAWPAAWLRQRGLEKEAEAWEAY
ncbi:MAG: conjugal transfer protein TrbE [Acidihalobacter sp.]|uniref:VirB4 family type IV secretion/conjugal transfer ATPase n=1 Tax=Acidihalobacter sp. TaxID=1872108 RepID=UPI00307D676C